MFVKVTPRKKKGKTYYYAELVESYREKGKVKHKRILYFGSVDLETAEKLKIVFSSDFDSFTNYEKIKFVSSVSYGNFYLINHIMENIDIFNKLEKRFETTDSHITIKTAIDCIKAMVFQRIINPDSKLALTEWHSKTPIKYFLNSYVDLKLQTVYRALEVLEENFEIVEEKLYDIAVNQFGQKESELYYDITSSYFEGHKCIIAEYGYSRDKRRDKEQLVIGLVTTSDGFPIKCDIYPGNTTDKTTVVKIVEELKSQYPIEEIVFVGDRGMLTAKNIDKIKELSQKFVMAIPRAWSKKYLKNIEIDIKNMSLIKENLYAKYISTELSEDQFLLCLNVDKKIDDKNFRDKNIKKIKDKIAELNDSIRKNEKLTNEDIFKKIGVILKSNNTGKYFDLSATDEKVTKLEYTINTEKLQNDEKLDGTFLIQTNKKTYDENKLLEVYKNLSKVENAFKIIKNNLDVRPMYHWKESRVKGHIYMCVLSYFIYNSIEITGKEAKIGLSAESILNKLDAIKLVEANIENGRRKFSLTEISKTDKGILNKFKIKKVQNPV